MSDFATYDPANPKAVLSALEQRARRRFGQHFLNRRDLVERMVRAAGVGPDDRVLEIGPGLGILTEALLKTGAKVTAIELDRDLAVVLRERFPNLALIEADALRVSWPSICEGTGWKVVANLPYNVGTSIINALLTNGSRFQSITVMLQKEVVQRFFANPGDDAYGSLSVFIQSRALPIPLFDIPPTAFIPPPKVMSSVIRLDPFKKPDTGTASPELFEKVVRAGFSQRRKTLQNSLSTIFSKTLVLEVLMEVGIDPKLRAETLNIEQFRALAAAFAVRDSHQVQ